MMTQLRTFAPLPIFTPRNRTQFSTSPSITQPSAISELETLEFRPYFAGMSSRTFV